MEDEVSLAQNSAVAMRGLRIFAIVPASEHEVVDRRIAAQPRKLLRGYHDFRAIEVEDGFPRGAIDAPATG